MKITQAKVNSLRATVAHCASIEGLPAEYMKPFAQPDADAKCLCCGERATFTWGLAHGEGHCFKCGWPARLYHFVKDSDGKERRVVTLLQYHPDGIEVGRRQKSAA